MSQQKPLTFGELNVGDRFIGRPRDGDDAGHCGLRGGSFLFEKISMEFRNSDMTTVENARRLYDGNTSNMPLGMPVYKILT